MPSAERRQRQGKEREIIEYEFVESMECVKKSWINGFSHAKKENAYQPDCVEKMLLLFF
jgi:hypothetical protein